MIVNMKSLATLDRIASHAPAEAIAQAREILTLVREVGYQEPHVTRVQFEDEISLEWWNGKRHLSIYISATSVEALKVWGSNIVTEMEDVTIDGPVTLIELWKWLRESEAT